MKTRVLIVLASCLLVLKPCATPAAQPVLANPILFVTVTPTPNDFAAIASTFGNHLADLQSSTRGGDLYIRYPDGTLKNLTRAAGFGHTGDQSTNGIAVRQPCVYWDGKKALFSMVIGAPKQQFQVTSFFWQMYEITNFLDPNATPIITKVPNQPTNCNNVSPFYGTDDKIFFTSDRPRNGDPALYPQRDEYEEAPTITGIWCLDPMSGKLNLLNHTPSGAFTPGIDSYGRIIFTRWDHLQRDQQADGDNVSNGQNAGTFNYADETGSAIILTNNRAEVFPEPRTNSNAGLNGFTFNDFFPWQINEDGTGEETMNHVGRHELGGHYGSISFTNDSNLRYLDVLTGSNQMKIENMLEITESPVTPGLYYAVDGPEFFSHGGGQLITLTGGTNVNPDAMVVHYLTPRSTSNITNNSNPVPQDHTGFYRNPVPMTDGTLVCVHTPTSCVDANQGSPTNPVSLYYFRLKTVVLSNNYYVPDTLLTPGFTNSVSWWDPDKKVSYSNVVMWEMDPVEIHARMRPARRVETIDVPEQLAFSAEGVLPSDLQNYLRAHNLALIISRNVTTRDHADKLQPFNLRIPGGAQTLGTSNGPVYNIQFLQILQGDQVRGMGFYNSNSTPKSGRRVLAQYLHEPLVDNPSLPPSAPIASVQLGLDGSMAAFVPARRALSWHLLDPSGNSVVKERYWLTFQPGEIRTCANCHGVNTRNQANAPGSTITNTPLALRALLHYWKSTYVPAPMVQTNGGSKYLAVSFNRRTAATNITYTVEVSSNMTTWLPGSVYSFPSNTPNTALTTQVSCTGSNTQSIVVRDNQPIVNGVSRFIRVKAVAN